MLQLHPDRKQALRAGRVLLGVVAYVMWMAAALYLYSLDLVTIDLPWLLVYFGLMFATNVVFLTAIWTNLNLRFPDPGMTFSQIAAGILWGMVLITQTMPEARGGMLLIFVTSFFFGVFRLATRQFLFLTVLASVAYGLLVVAEWEELEDNTRRIELAQWAFLTLMLFWMSFMGGYVARLRANLRNAMRKIELLAHQDHLTGANNRRAITGTLDSALAYANRTGTPLAICMLDIDHFKRINDRYGHMVGDQVLKAFVERVEGQLRSADVIRGQEQEQQEEEPLGRFGGEEFLVVLPGSDLDGARQAAERIRAAVAETPFPTEKGDVSLTVSIGVTDCRPEDEPDDLLRRSDEALYKSKEGGRNRVAVSD